MERLASENLQKWPALSFYLRMHFKQMFQYLTCWEDFVSAWIDLWQIMGGLFFAFLTEKPLVRAVTQRGHFGPGIEVQIRFWREQINRMDVPVAQWAIWSIFKFNLFCPCVWVITEAVRRTGIADRN